jgi:queuine tRNA-ribosyltransferase subunit QTRTD1
VEKGIPQSPVFQQPGPTPLRAFTSHPSSSLMFLAARRCPPVPAPATNTDHSIAMLTSVGFRELEVNDFISSTSRLQPDAVIAMVDIPGARAGKNRIPKMVDRTELWLEALLREAAETGTPTFAPILPVEAELQEMYLQTLEEKASQLAGLAFYDSTIVPHISKTLERLPRLALDDAGNPHKLLQGVARGMDVFTLVFALEATDAGIELEFEFPGTLPQEGGIKPLGRDMWAAAEEMKTDTRPLVEGCSCYACTRHHRAYLVHLLSAKEMTAWVLLQIHNTHMIERFFAAVRESIAKGTFEEDCKTFNRVYEEKLPEKTGHGPRYVFVLLDVAWYIRAHWGG